MSVLGNNTAGRDGAQQAIYAQLLGAQQALGALKPAYEKARGDLTSQDYYTPWTYAGTGATKTLADSLGLNGAEGNARAVSAFQTSPGYQFQFDQGLQALNRSAAARGLLTSGNNTIDLVKLGQGLANQDYGNWQSKVGGLSQLGLSAAGGETGRQNTLANLDYGYGTGQAGIWSNLGNSVSNSITRGNEADAAANNQAQANLFGGILGGLGLGAKVLTGNLFGSPNLSTSSGALRSYNGQAEWPQQYSL